MSHPLIFTQDLKSSSSKTVPVFKSRGGGLILRNSFLKVYSTYEVSIGRFVSVQIAGQTLMFAFSSEKES